MTLHTLLRALVALTTVALAATPALAQDIEAGATTRSYEASADASASSPGSSSVRIGLQIRLDALTMLGPLDSSTTAPGNLMGGLGGAETIGRRLLVPLATAGVRLLDQRLFIGAGIGLHGWSVEADSGAEASRSGFGLSPLAQFDVLRDGAAALSLGGALHFASLSETEACDPDGDCMDQNDGASAVGLSLGAGVRGHITPGLALGGDLGWGFLSISTDDDDSIFVHGIYAALMVEGTVGI
jgi:hypothetical protein